jgi:glycosyltransferase involved in cell wall biosynthesis
MKILFINHEFPPIGGGAATITKELFSRFENSGYDLYLLTGNIPEIRPNITALHTGRKSDSKGSVFEFIRFIFGGIFRLSEIQRNFHPNIVFAFFTIPGGFLALLNKIFYKTPYIVSIRGGDMPGFQMGKKYGMLQFFAYPVIKLICRSAAIVHVNSLRLRELTQKIGVPPRQISYLPNGINFSKEQTIIKGEHKKLRLLFTGRLSKQKNLAVFLRALSMIKEDFSFTIIGDGPEKKRLFRLTRLLKLRPKVTFISWTTRKNLQDYYQENDIFVLPSLDEGMSNSALEAVQNHCALLASANAHLQWTDEEMLKNWVVEDFRHPQAWKEAMEKIARSDIGKMGWRMNQFLKENNDWDTLFEQYKKMVKKCVA